MIALPPPNCEVVVLAALDGSPLCAVSLLITGDGDALQQIQQKAAKAGLHGGPMTLGGQSQGSLVVLKSDSHTAALAFYRALLADHPGEVTITLMVVPVAKLADGSADESEATQMALSDVTEPKP